MSPSKAHKLWALAPAAAEAAVEQLCYARLKRPESCHIAIIPRLLTSRWRKQLSKTTDLIFTLNCGVEFWNSSQHKPLLFAVTFPLRRYKPWRLRGTAFVEHAGRRLQEVQSFGAGRLGAVLHELFIQVLALESMPRGMV